MKKIWVTLGFIAYLFLLMIIYKTSFFKTWLPPARVVEPSPVNYRSQLDINSPEGLAQASGQLYKELTYGKVSAEQTVAQLEQWASEESQREMERKKSDFTAEIRDYIQYSKENDIRIRGFEFGKTVYLEAGKASIERIQRNTKGRDYYYKQDFVREKGFWRIAGDNAEEPFRIERHWEIPLFIKDERGIMP